MKSYPADPINTYTPVQYYFRRWLCAVTVILTLTLPVANGAASADSGKGPRPGKQSLTGSDQLQISEDDRCPVCGMKVARHAKFASAIQLKDNTTFYFCGTGCMIRSWMHPEVFLATPKDTLLKPVAREYFTGKPIDARMALWVAGSDIVGPMGPALVPLKDEKSVAVFMRRHGGKATFRLNEMDDQKWLEITGKKALKAR